MIRDCPGAISGSPTHLNETRTVCWLKLASNLQEKEERGPFNLHSNLHLVFFYKLFTKHDRFTYWEGFFFSERKEKTFRHPPIPGVWDSYPLEPTPFLIANFKIRWLFQVSMTVIKTKVSITYSGAIFTSGALPTAFWITRNSLVTISITWPVWNTKSPFPWTSEWKRQPIWWWWWGVVAPRNEEEASEHELGLGCEDRDFF